MTTNGVSVQFDTQSTQSFESRLQELIDRARRTTPDVVVGYTGANAFRLHEDMAMAGRGHPRPSGIGHYWDGIAGAGQSKYLETPARLNAGKYGDIIVARLKEGAVVHESLFTAGEALMEDSKMLVPYEYGDLHRGAFVRYDVAGSAPK